MDLFISLKGNDTWSGKLPEPNKQKTDGPLATLHQAVRVVNKLSVYDIDDNQITINLREGVYNLDKPVVINKPFSFPVTIKAYTNEKPIISGGVEISGWTETMLNGVKVWKAELPEVKEGSWKFIQLWVNGERRERARLPKAGYFNVDVVPGKKDDEAWLLFQQGDNLFRFTKGDIKNWDHVTEAVIRAYHWWVDEYMPIEWVDEESRYVKSTLTSCMNMVKTRYYIENLLEALTEPDEWCLINSEGALYYFPQKGEVLTKTKVIAPKLNKFIIVEGNYDKGEIISNLSIEGITFEYSNINWPIEGMPTYKDKKAADPQGACDVYGSVVVSGAENIKITDCALKHIGGYGIEIGNGCKNIEITYNAISDMGAGGVFIHGGFITDPPATFTSKITVTDNEISYGGRIFRRACGIFAQHASRCVFSHNHIYELFYTGISSGWIWGYADNPSHHNIIEHNHIHHLGNLMLADMGGIYLIGEQPGTEIRGNLVHDVYAIDYGGWGIYMDEGSSHVTIENNICYNFSHQPFHQHYGRENVLRNNIFAFGNAGQYRITRTETHNSIIMLRNIILSDKGAFDDGITLEQAEKPLQVSESNLFWNINGKLTEKDLNVRRTLGHDLLSVVADPKIGDLLNGNFTIADDSPALKLGFKPIDISKVGCRPKPKSE